MDQGAPTLNGVLRDLISAKRSVDENLKLLQKHTEVATIAFFDLVGSTRFRRVRGPVAGLMKAERHNMLVSEAIVAHNGEIVKWLGDGVMAMYRGNENGMDHPIRALHSAAEAIKNLDQWNTTNVPSSERSTNWDEEIHTKVGISTGSVHLLTAHLENAQATAKPLTDADPMGTAVDVAARLDSLAMPDTVLIDSDTFWGEPVKDIKPRTTAICQTSREELESCSTSQLYIAQAIQRAMSDGEEAPSATLLQKLFGQARKPKPKRTDMTEPACTHGWRELLLGEERTTTYLPKAAPFLLQANGLELLQIGSTGEPISPADFHKLAREVADREDSTKKCEIVFACEPVGCNVAGFPERVQAIAISFLPKEKPIKQVPYDFPSRADIEKLLEQADEYHRLGNPAEARKKYEEVLRNDPRDFRANVRMAQYLRRMKQPKEAARHWDEAKQSNPSNPMIWALAGTTHLEIYIERTVLPEENSPQDQHEIDKHRDRSITGFTRARKMAAMQFDSSLEQHCACFLAICHSLRRHEDDLIEAERLIKELACWPPQTTPLAILHELAKAFFYVVTEGRAYDAAGQALEQAKSLVTSIVQRSSNFCSTAGNSTADSQAKCRQDGLMEEHDFESLITFAELRLKVAKRRFASSATTS